MIRYWKYWWREERWLPVIDSKCHMRSSFIWNIDLLISTTFRIIICSIIGHKWIDESWAGPDSGGMGMRCDRCGESWHHTLY